MKKYIALVLAVVSLFAACDTSTDAPHNELVRVGIGSADVRSVLPTVTPLENMNYFSLYGTTSSKENWLADFVYKNGAFYDYNNQNVRAAAYVKPGNWSFTLYGYPPEGSGSAKLKGTATANITAGFTGTVNFTLSPYIGEGDGAVYLRINLPQGSDVASVETTIDGTVLDPPLPVNAGAIEYVSNETPAGQYLFSFALKDAAGKTVAVVSDVVVVAEGAESSKQYTLTDADLNGPPSAAPSNLAVASYNAESLTFHFTWVDNSVNETGFTLTDGTSTRTAPAASQSLDFPVIDPAAPVTYTVKAVNAFGESASTQITGPIKFTVTFDADDGSGMTESRQANAGASFGANLLAPPMRTNYSFGGWYPNRNGEGEEFTAYSAVLSDTTVYAKWMEGIRYELTQNPAFDNYIYNAGDILPSGFSVETGERIRVSFSIKTDTNITGFYVGIGDWNNDSYYNGVDEDGWIAPGWSDTKTVQADGQFHQLSWTLTALSDAPAGIEPLVFHFAIDSVSAQRVAVYVKDMVVEKNPGVPRDLSLIESLAWISNNAVEGGDYTITLNNNETIAPQTLSYNGKQIGIALNGGTTERTVSLSSNGSLFTISEGVTLTLVNNVTLQGRSANTASLVAVDSGGALVTESGSKISGNTFAAYGGGASVNSGGTLTMNGGEISGNTAYYGGGVYIYEGGTFVKQSGGTVHGSDASGSLKNTATGGSGHAVYAAGSPVKRRNTTAGAGVFLNSETSGSAGGWDTVADISDVWYDFVSVGNWALQSDGRRKSPTISIGGTTKSRVRFTSNVPNASIVIQLDASMYASSYAFISTLDNASTTYSSGYYNRISGTNTATLTIPVPTVGDHFVDIGYYRYSSYSTTSDDDCAWFKVIGDIEEREVISAGVSDISYGFVSLGTWALQSDGRRKSPTISYGETTKSRINFTSNVPNASIVIQLDVFMYYTNSYAFISTLDNASATYNSGYYNRIYVVNSATITIPVPTVGDHFVDIGYYRYSSTTTSDGDDCAWFKVVEAGAPASDPIDDPVVNPPVDDTPAAISNIVYSSVSGGTWTLQSDGRRQSPSVSDYYGETIAQVSFTSNVPNASITIQLDVSSESGCDYAFIGVLDDVGYYYVESAISGEDSTIMTISVPTAGNHFIYIWYQKDGSVYGGSDCAWFKVIQ